MLIRLLLQYLGEEVLFPSPQFSSHIAVSLTLPCELGLPWSSKALHSNSSQRVSAILGFLTAIWKCSRGTMVWQSQGYLIPFPFLGDYSSVIEIQWLTNYSFIHFIYISLFQVALSLFPIAPSYLEEKCVDCSNQVTNIANKHHMSLKIRNYFFLT